MESKKWQIILHEDCEDPYYEITNGPISLIANCGFVGEDDADEENIFRRVFDALDQSGIRFHSGNPLELTQHIEIQKFKHEMEALQARCDRYENERYETRLAMRMLLKAFKGDIKTERHKEWYAKAEAIFNKYHNVADALRNEALSGEGKEDEKAFTVDQVDKMLIEFALMYHKNPQKDIANDAAEYLNDKIINQQH